MPRWSVCSTPDCPELHQGSGKCDDCRRAAEKQRPNRHQRGYDSHYVKVRDAAVEGATHCETCGQAFTQTNPATGGHRIDVRAGGTTDDGIFPQCRRCNLGWRRTNGRTA